MALAAALAAEARLAPRLPEDHRMLRGEDLPRGAQAAACAARVDAVTLLCVVAFLPDSIIATAHPSEEHAHELRVVKKFLVTRLQRLPCRVKSLDE